ncbi:acyl-protein thioesterase 1 [Moniliophthora roreri]|nr:acyl-protein thioesterase 1 [Moniliophthora roreri]
MNGTLGKAYTPTACHWDTTQCTPYPRSTKCVPTTLIAYWAQHQNREVGRNERSSADPFRVTGDI